MADSGENRVQLEDNDDGSAPASDPSAQETSQADPSQTDASAKKSSGGIASAPRNFGDSAGAKMESVMSPVGKPLGKGLSMVASPVGGLVEPLVGGLTKSGDAYGAVAGVGSGNMEHRNREEQEELHKPYGGNEQTGENPLGL